MDSLDFKKFAFALVVAIVAGVIFGCFLYNTYGAGMTFTSEEFEAFHQKRLYITMFSTLGVSATTFFGIWKFTK